MKFFSVCNNGICAVISEEHAALLAQVLKEEQERGQTDRQKANMAAIDAGVRVFTFCYDSDDSRDINRHCTGTRSDLRRLIEEGGHELTSDTSGSDWSGYVPFSNYYESGMHGVEAAKQELNYRTSLRDVLEVFGVQIAGKSATEEAVK